jgi:hypothetical protein
VPFHRKGQANLTERLDVRVAHGEKEQLRGIARAAGLGVSDLVRLRALGRPVVSRTDATTIRELRRVGGLLKKVHVDSGGAYNQQTAAALRTLHAAIARLAGHEPNGAP